MITTIATLAVAILGQNPSINDVLQKNFDDASFTARKKKGDQRELAKINRDFGQSYRFAYTNVKLKEPLMLRLDTKVDDTSLVFILNGTRQMIKAGPINQKNDLSRSPGRRQTPLDFGLLTPSMFRDLFVAKFVRLDRATNDYVFDITYLPKFDDTSRHRVWIDPERKFTTKREWYNQSGRQLATFLYEEPKQADGMWLPTRLTVKNMDNKTAGVTEYEGVRINQGISAELFRIP